MSGNRFHHGVIGFLSDTYFENISIDQVLIFEVKCDIHISVIEIKLYIRISLHIASKFLHPSMLYLPVYWPRVFAEIFSTKKNC